MLSGKDNGTDVDHLTFLRELELWCKERETYPSRLQVRCANTLTVGMIIPVEAQPQKNPMPITEDRSNLLSSHMLIDEMLRLSPGAGGLPRYRASPQHASPSH